MPSTPAKSTAPTQHVVFILVPAASAGLGSSSSSKFPVTSSPQIHTHHLFTSPTPSSSISTFEASPPFKPPSAFHLTPPSATCSSPSSALNNPGHLRGSSAKPSKSYSPRSLPHPRAAVDQGRCLHPHLIAASLQPELQSTPSPVLRRFKCRSLPLSTADDHSTAPVLLRFSGTIFHHPLSSNHSSISWNTSGDLPPIWPPTCSSNLLAQHPADASIYIRIEARHASVPAIHFNPVVPPSIGSQSVAIPNPATSALKSAVDLQQAFLSNPCSSRTASAPT